MALLWCCFAVSGAAALALEMLWLRSAGLVLGQTAATAATVLACYFAGLALGARAGRAVGARAVLVYGWLEIGAGLAALWSLAVFHAAGSATVQRWIEALAPLGGIVAVGLATLPATICLGATLPALGRALERGSAAGRRAGLLYAFNTFGGGVGIAAAGFGMPALVGVDASYVLVAAMSIAIGVIALGIGRRLRSEFVQSGRGVLARQPRSARLAAGTAASTPETSQDGTIESGTLQSEALQSGTGVLARQPRSARLAAGTAASTLSSAAGEAASILLSPSRARLRIVAGGAGALALGLEVLWTRLFAQVLHNSVYSFAAVVLVYVLAIAAGAACASLAMRRGQPAALAGGALLGAAIATVGGLWLFVFLTDGLAYVGMHSGLGEYLLRIIGLAAVTVGPAALASGMVLPAAWAAWGSDTSAARPLGDLSAANTLGSIAGALGVGFGLIPVLGMRGALLTIALAYVVLADVVAPRGARWRPLAYAALLLIALADPLRAPLVNLRNGETLRAVAEGPNGVVSVVETADDLQLRLDNFYVLGGSAAATNERRLGLVPLLLHPDPHSALFIGMATGISASAAPALGVDDTTVVELVPEVAAAARAHFGEWNGGVLERGDVRQIVGDGRRFLTATDERFDVIVSDLFIPWHAGAGSLYAREMYEAAAAHLADDGLYCQWLPLYQLTREDFALIARTFLSVFPVATLWRADFYPDRPVVGLVGQLLPRRVDLARVRERIDRLPAWGRDPLLATPRGLLLLYGGDLAPATDLIAGETINTDDQPLLEFAAPRLTRINADGDKDWFTGESLAGFIDALAARARVAPDPLLPATDDVVAARRAGGLLSHYALAAQRKDQRAAGELEDEIRRLVPEVVASGESVDAVGSLTDAKRALVGLQSEQAQVRRQLEAMERRLGELNRHGEASP